VPRLEKNQVEPEQDDEEVEQEFEQAFTLEDVGSPKISISNLPCDVTPTTKPLSLLLEPESEEDEIAL